MGIQKIVNSITSFFLRAKHWQIFLLLVGVGNVAILSCALATLRSPEDFLKIGLVFGAAMMLFMCCLLAWQWSMGSFLSSLVPPALRLNVGFFRFALIYPAVYIIVFMSLFQSIATKPALFAVIFPFHFFATFCMLYLLYFVSKNLVLAETRKPASFPDYAGPFFLIWLFPIGIWFTQPRINRLYERPPPPQMAIELETTPSLPLEPASTPGDYAHGMPTEAPPVYAGFWPRFAAALLDCMVMFIPFCFVVMIVLVISKLVSTAKGDDTGTVILAFLPLTIIFLASFYLAVMESSPLQGTLGKKALGLYVSDIEGRRLTLGRAIGRTLAKYLSSMTFGIGYIMCGFTRKKQALHDMIAGCLVLRRKRNA
jgi:uncharacterized RDD family membrane protein YckC